MKQYTCKGRIYSVVKCVKEDIPSHIERVSSYWTADGVDVEQQTQLLGDRYRDWETDRKSTRLNSSHSAKSRMPSSA